ncbi:MAG: endonuclease/exonuclease/phosphatase family protein, partial [Planctomycetes bacterium]|nr:endonuclease/exonuclease/phosphatase family protein [Planctomycetota bacterium]
MRLRIMTYNIHKAIGVDRRFRPERIIAMIEYYNPEVLLLQEVDHGAPRSGHMYLASEIAHALRYDHRAFGINVYLKRGKYGNATLSRFPIGRQPNIDLAP